MSMQEAPCTTSRVACASDPFMSPFGYPRTMLPLWTIQSLLWQKTNPPGSGSCALTHELTSQPCKSKPGRTNPSQHARAQLRAVPTQSHSTVKKEESSDRRCPRVSQQPLYPVHGSPGRICFGRRMQTQCVTSLRATPRSHLLQTDGEHNRTLHISPLALSPRCEEHDAAPREVQARHQSLSRHTCAAMQDFAEHVRDSMQDQRLRHELAEPLTHPARPKPHHRWQQPAHPPPARSSSDPTHTQAPIIAHERRAHRAAQPLAQPVRGSKYAASRRLAGCPARTALERGRLAARGSHVGVHGVDGRLVALAQRIAPELERRRQPAVLGRPQLRLEVHALWQLKALRGPTAPASAGRQRLTNVLPMRCHPRARGVRISAGCRNPRRVAGCLPQTARQACQCTGRAWSHSRRFTGVRLGQVQAAATQRNSACATCVCH